MENKLKSNFEHGFTLVELMVVIAIIALLSSVILVTVSNAREKSRNAKRVADMQQFGKAMELFFADNNTYPTVIAGTALSAWNSAPLVTKYLTKLPATILPVDPGCAVGPGNSTNDYYMMPNVAGTQVTTNTFIITFCISGQTGTLIPGAHTLTQTGFQ